MTSATVWGTRVGTQYPVAAVRVVPIQTATVWATSATHVRRASLQCATFKFVLCSGGLSLPHTAVVQPEVHLWIMTRMLPLFRSRSA